MKFLNFFFWGITTKGSIYVAKHPFNIRLVVKENAEIKKKEESAKK